VSNYSEVVLILALACGARVDPPSNGGTTDGPTDDGSTDDGGGDGGSDGATEGPLPDPILLVHGINGSDADWATYEQWLVAAGWPAERIVAKTFSDPAWGCNVDNAAALSGWVDEVLAATGAARVDVVAHSMGTLSSRYFLERLGGEGKIDAYVTLGGMHNGLDEPCWSPFEVCVWQELCSVGDFMIDLHDYDVAASGARWTSISSKADDTVAPDRAAVEGAENIVLDAVAHDGATGFQELAEVFAMVRERL
jgi:triacylglycerol lipase